MKKRKPANVILYIHSEHRLLILLWENSIGQGKYWSSLKNDSIYSTSNIKSKLSWKNTSLTIKTLWKIIPPQWRIAIQQKILFWKSNGFNNKFTKRLFSFFIKYANDCRNKFQKELCWTYWRRYFIFLFYL